MKKINFAIFVFLLTSVCLPRFAAAQQTTTDTTQKITPVGTSTVWGTVDGVAIEGMVQGPSADSTPLQVACVFEYTEGDIYTSPPALPAALNGMVHLDEGLNGIITDIRKSGKFSGHAFETILITPPPGMIAAKKLLLIGLGDKTKFTPDMMTEVAQIALREALRLGVTSYAFASDLKDGGIDSPTALVAADEVKGTIEAYRTEAYLKSKSMADYIPLTKITLLAGPAFFITAGQGIKDAIATLK